MNKIPVRQIIEDPMKPASFERFKIRSVEEILGGKDLKQELHRHDFFFILALKNGHGMHEIDFSPYNVIGNSVFFLRPGQVHQLELKAGSTGYLMEFNTRFYHPGDKISIQRLRKASNKIFCKLDANRFEKVHAILSNIYQEYTLREDGYLDIIKANLQILLIELVRQSSHPDSLPASVNAYTRERLEEFLDHLDNHVTTHKHVSQFTGMMNLSAYQLNEITKATIGKTPSMLINDRIILEAKRYLLATSNQVKDIADLLGYEDVSYFIRFFRKHTGHSPEAFRHNFS